MSKFEQYQLQLRGGYYGLLDIGKLHLTLQLGGGYYGFWFDISHLRKCYLFGVSIHIPFVRVEMEVS